MQDPNKNKKLITLDKYQRRGQVKTHCKDGYGCHGNSSTMTGDGIRKVGSRLSGDDGGSSSGGDGGYFDWKSLNVPLNWQELIQFNNPNTDGEKKKVAQKMIDDYNNKINNRTASLQSQFPGLTADMVRVAGADSNRISTKVGDLPTWDKPANQTYDQAWFPFYRSLMKPNTPVTIPQIIQFQSQQPGGLPAYQATVESNYGKKKSAYGGENNTTMNKYQEGGNAQQDVMKQLVGYIQQAIQAGQHPEQIAQDLIQQGVPPQGVAQIFVQMGMPQDQAIAAVQAGAQGGAAQQQAPAEEQPQAAEPQMRMGGKPCYNCGGSYAYGGDSPDGRALVNAYANGGAWNGTFSGNQGFAYGGVNPYMYNDPYSYMRMGGKIPRAQYGGNGVPPRPQPQDYPDYGTFKAEDDNWVMTYGDQAMDYTDEQWTPDTLGYANPALSMVQNAGKSAVAPASNPSLNAPIVPTVAGITPAATIAAPVTSGGITLVDYLNSYGKGAPSSFAARKIIANAVGIPNYTGTPEQDAVIITALKAQGAPDPFGTASPSMLKGLDPNTGLPASASTMSNPVSASTTVPAATTTSTGTTTAPAPARFRTSKSAQKSNAATQAALNNIAATADSTGSNAIKNPVDSTMATDSIPIVPLTDTIPTPIDSTDTRTAAQKLADSLMNGVASPDTLTGAALDSSKKAGIALTSDEIARRDKAHADAINNAWKSAGLTAASTIGIYGAYRARKKAIEDAKKAGVLSEDFKESAVKQGELVNDILKKYQDPKEILRMAKDRGFSTVYDKAIFKDIKDKKLKAEFDKIPHNDKVDPFAQRTIDMAKDGWKGADDLFTPETLKNLTAYLDDNMKQAREIIEAAEERGYRTPDDVRKLRELMGNDRQIIEISGGLRTQKPNKFSSIAGIEGGTNQPKGTPQPDQGTYPEAEIGEPKEPGRFRKALTEARADLKDMTWKTFFDRALWGPEGKENAGLYKLWNGFDEFEGLKAKMSKLKVKLGDKVVGKYNFVPGEGMEGNKGWSTFVDNVGAIGGKNPINDKMQSVIDAFKGTVGKEPKNTADVIAQYHTDLEAGHRTPLVEAVEAATGIPSIKQRVGGLGNTFDGLKKKVSTAISNVDMYPGTAGNVQSPFQSVNQAAPTVKRRVVVAEPEIAQGPTAAELRQLKKVRGTKSPIRSVTNKSKITQDVINDVLSNGTRYAEPIRETPTVERNIIEPVETPSLFEGLKGALGNFIKVGRKVKEEYGGPIMEDGGSYIPNYAMAYGGDIPQAMYGMGMAEGGMYEDGGSPLFSTQGQQLRNYMNTAAYTPGGWMPNHFDLPPVGFNSYQYAMGGEPCEGNDPNMIRNEEGRCVCKPGYTADQETGQCFPASGNKSTTPSGNSSSNHSSGSGMNNGNTGGFHGGFGISDKRYNFNYGYNTDANFGNTLHTADFNLTNPFHKRGSLGIGANYAPNRFWNANIKGGIPLSKGNAMLNFTGGVGRNFVDPAEGQNLEAMKLAPTGMYNNNTGSNYNQAAWNAAIGVTGNIGKNGPKYNVNASYSNMTPREYGGPTYKKGGIHINPANKGKFTKSASAAGMGTQEFARHVLSNKDRYSSTQVKRANFARNAAGWKHQDGGLVAGQEMNVSPEQLQMLQQGGYQFEIMH
jgi:hypothetical protein